MRNFIRWLHYQVQTNIERAQYARAAKRLARYLPDLAGTRARKVHYTTSKYPVIEIRVQVSPELVEDVDEEVLIPVLGRDVLEAARRALDEPGMIVSGGSALLEDEDE